MRLELRVVVALGILLAGLPLAAPTLAAEMVVDNSDNVIQVKGKWTQT